MTYTAGTITSHPPTAEKEREMNYTAEEAYNEDVRSTPYYADGAPRPAWETLPDHVKESWRLNPTPRGYNPPPKSH